MRKVVTVMIGAKAEESEDVQTRSEFHLIDLVPRDCYHTVRADLETKLQTLERSLHSWLAAKIEEIEAGQTDTIAGKNAPILRGFGEDAAARGQAIPAGEQEEVLMSTDDRDILKVLQTELDFIEQGGYGRSVKTPWKPKSAFEDSLTCINYAYLEKAHSCSECHLIDFVPAGHRGEKVPCHFIPLNESGENIDHLELNDNQQKLEGTLKTWLREKIKTITAARLASTSQSVA